MILFFPEQINNMATKKNLEEYIVTLKSCTDLEQFYDDLETLGGDSCVPRRKVKCCNKREISRNTHYLLTPEEAETLKNDDRVLDIIPKSIQDMMFNRPEYTQTSSNWSKSISTKTIDRNWGLLRCTLGEQINNWGSNETTDQSGTIRVTSSGKNVDVVVVDGHLDPTHPEFAVNEDGSGGSRVILYNWYELGFGSNATYVYPTGSDLHNYEDNHGMHVAGTVVGNSQGWARDANIYMISPYSNAFVFDYIRAFHNNKPINPLTGRKNPTICNNSWGSYYSFTRSDITNINWRGTDYTTDFTDANLRSYGIVDFDENTIYVQAWTNALVADIEDTINDGIILVGAAGNESSKIDTVGGIDYNNTITVDNSFTTPYHRGSWNTVGGNAICVGSIDSFILEIKNELKASYSNCGPRVDIYSPGNQIISCLHTAGGGVTLVNDFRNSNYKVGKYQGTSMASPQVCGVLACLLEQYPNFNQNNVVDYLNNTVKENQITDTGGGYTDDTSLQGSNNNYLYYKKERMDSGTISPKVNRNIRANSGQVYPRTNMVTYGK
jgi:hypothetical protein